MSENTLGATALSTPVRAPEHLLLALSIAGPEVRLPRRKLLGYREELLRAAKKIEQDLAHTGPGGE